MRGAQANRYATILQNWEQEAYAGEYGEDWLVEVGESVRWYCEKCRDEGMVPTFSGLMGFLLDRKERC